MPSPSSDTPSSPDAVNAITLSRRGFGKRLLLSASALAVMLAGSKSQTAQAAPTTPWVLGGNTTATDGTEFLGTRNVAPLVFKTAAAAGSPVERMRITPPGNVGIGITTPAAKLEVRSTTWAVLGRHTATSGTQPGVYGETAATVDGASGVQGVVKSTAAGYDSAAVKGVNKGTFSVSYGVLGTSASEEGSGVAGFSPYRGVSGQSTGVNGAGVYGSAGFAGGAAYGVAGETVSSSADAAGVLGLFLNAVAGQKAAGVRGIMNATQGSAQGAGVWGSSSTYGRGVYGESTNGNGVYGESTNGNGVYGYAMRGHAMLAWGHGGDLGRAALKAVSSQVQGGWAANFDGKIYVKYGVDSPAAQSLLVDHPLDPANTYLAHAAVAAPEQLTLYNGTVTLDATGTATVVLPAYFEALNRDFRYQLTAIGAPGPNLHVAAEIKDNRFMIGGGAPGMKVSWQVSGTRNDPYARQHPLQVEAAKPTAERGKYLYPRGYGQPETRGVSAEEAPPHVDRQTGTPPAQP